MKLAKWLDKLDVDSISLRCRQLSYEEKQTWWENRGRETPRWLGHKTNGRRVKTSDQVMANHDHWCLLANGTWWWWLNV